MQCHIQDKIVKFFSRNSNNYTHIYGPKMSSFILKNVEAQAAVLDGEMVVWDNFKKQMAPFGMNKNVAKQDPEEGDQIDGQGRYQLCYKIFDILFIKGLGPESQEIDLLGAALEERKRVLAKVVQEEPNILEVIQGVSCTTSEQVFELFNQSIQNNEEGIIIKSTKATYKPNERS